MPYLQHFKMKKSILLVVVTIVVAATLSEAVQFGLFNRPSHQSTTTSKPQPRGGLLGLNILKPVTSILDAVGHTVGAILNLLVGGLRYKPYKRITTTPMPTISVEITPPHIVSIEINTPPPTAHVVVSLSTKPSLPVAPPKITTPTSTLAAITESTTQSTVTSEKPTEPTTTESTTQPSPTPSQSPTTPTTVEVTTASTTHAPTTTTEASITEKGKPGNVDWRRLNCSSPITFQGKCRGSFAFAVTAAIEAQMCYKTGQYTVLSAQNLIDCTMVAPFENAGCDGGALEPTFDYVVNVGINSEEDYPYTASISKCKYNQEKSVGRINDYMSIDEGDEETMEYILNNVGPIAVGIDATHKSFADYRGGVYYEPNCKSDIESLNHAVLLVGYGVEPDGTKYWLIRNSYGTEWGDKGYGKIARTATNHCGINTYAVYPVVV
ncbi:hypothetical protein PPYR_05111 [Photinus pyralis]|uniref:Peptidase C1A papain C-terminal domain-containing protein n=1 Tax=Photinus pyralis TaxID=7054 RepID=A0A5N4ALH2_PHOPY|nr:cathepsin S-like [Photinus pyralis]XP_031344917.1 cathepsin S-like [Photinus pyralis]KAB0798068.1 hypothetical protein PPYR_09061 [Photinus pyralis]KAB0802925.1 hypothetical protein PPYR_05111 [Photinus pyralis]